MLFFLLFTVGTTIVIDLRVEVVCAMSMQPEYLFMEVCGIAQTLSTFHKTSLYNLFCEMLIAFEHLV